MAIRWKSNYLFIFEDGTANVSTQPPTAIDLEQIADGVLQIFVTTSNIGEVLADNSVDEIPVSRLSGVKGKQYHTPAEPQGD